MSDQNRGPRPPYPAQMTEKLCQAYRDGCQKDIMTKLDHIGEKLNNIDKRYEAHEHEDGHATMKIRVLNLEQLVNKNIQNVDANQLAMKVLQTNDMQHLRNQIAEAQAKAESAEKARREPLGWKEKVVLIGIGIASATNILIEVIRYFKP